MKREMDALPQSDREEQILKQLRKLGLRPTSARLYILHVLHEHGPAAMPVERIFLLLAERGIRLSLGSIYRVLNELAQRGVVQRERGLDATGKAYFLLAPEAGAQLAYRFRCPCCGRTFSAEDRPLTEALQRLARAGGFDAGPATLSINATCHACLAPS